MADKLVEKIIYEDFYFEESMGAIYVGVNKHDLYKINKDIFQALEELENAFYKKLDKKYDNLILVLNSKGEVMITVEK